VTDLTIEQILEGLGIPKEHEELAKELLAAQYQYQQLLGREPNRRERRAFEVQFRRAMKLRK
jgi:hypothetical protein